MRYICLLLFFVNICFAKVGLAQARNYEEVTPTDFDRTTTPAIGQYTKVSFKYRQLKSTTIDYDLGNNFFWFILVEKRGKIYMNDDLLQRGFTLAINRKMEAMDLIKATMHQLVDGKVKSVKLSKKLMEKTEQGDSTYYHFRFEGFTDRDICEISYSTETEFKVNLLTIRMNEISTLHEAKAEFIIPKYMDFTVHLFGIDDKLSQEEIIYESTKARGYASYQSKKTTYYSNPALPNVRPAIVATATYIRTP